MKKIIIFIGLITILSSCSSVKLADTWTSPNFDAVKKKKILVFARATEIEVRKVYEQEIVSKLKKEGVNAVASHKVFPTLKDKKNRSEEEIAQIVEMFKNKGIHTILVTALKDTKVLKSSPERKVSTTISTANIGRYGISFSNYYNVSSPEYLTRNLRPIDYLDDTEPTVELSSTIYVIETIIYDLSLEEKKQLVAVYHIEVTDPTSASQVLKGFSKIVSKQFVKK